MCAGCLTTVDSWVYAAVGTAAAVEAGCSRLRALVDARYAAERHVLTWERNAEFCRYMGLDPIATLGAKPVALPIEEPAWSIAAAAAPFLGADATVRWA